MASNVVVVAWWSCKSETMGFTLPVNRGVLPAWHPTGSLFSVINCLTPNQFTITNFQEVQVDLYRWHHAMHANNRAMMHVTQLNYFHATYYESSCLPAAEGQ